jgi:hypothetical protein
LNARVIVVIFNDVVVVVEILAFFLDGVARVAIVPRRQRRIAMNGMAIVIVVVITAVVGMGVFRVLGQSVQVFSTPVIQIVRMIGVKVSVVVVDSVVICTYALVEWTQLFMLDRHVV